MKVNLDKFELMSLIEGCAHGSHLRQGIWHRFIDEFIHHLTPEETDWFWWVMYRDLWECYFYSPEFSPSAGAEGYLQSLAACNRNNRFKIAAQLGDGAGIYTNVECYRFQGVYKPLQENSFYSIVPGVLISSIEQIRIPDADTCMENRFHIEWRDLSLYDLPVSEVYNFRNT